MAKSKLFKKEIETIHGIVNQAVAQFAAKAMEVAIILHAPVWSGEYVFSMRFTTGKAIPIYPRFNRLFDPVIITK